MYSREELIEALSALLDMTKSEEEQDRIFLRIDRNTLDPKWSDHIFHSNEFYGDNETIDLERLADKILGYKPISLP